MTNRLALRTKASLYCARYKKIKKLITPEVIVHGLTGMEKFSHLEDKIYRIIEECKALKQANESLERELTSTRRELTSLLDENQRLEGHIERLQNERDVIKLKVEAMLDAIAILDLEPSEVLKK